MKGRKGFTLLEMMTVIAIIVFLAGVAFTGASQYIQRASEIKYNNDARAAHMAEQDKVVDAYLTSTRARSGTETTDNELHHGGTTTTTVNNGGGGGGGGGGGASVVEPPEDPTTVTEPPEESTTEAVPSEPEITAAPEAGGVTSNNPYVTLGTSGNGVVSIDNNSDGSQTVKLLYSTWNEGTVKLTRNADGSYTMKMTSNNTYFLGAIIGYNHDFTGGFKLTDTEKTKLSDAYGLKFN